MEILSEDGEQHSNAMVVITEEDHDGHQVKVIKKKMITGDHPHGEDVIIMKSGEGETIEILTEEDEEEVFVISGDDVEMELKEIMEDHDGENVKVIVIKTKQKK